MNTPEIPLDLKAEAIMYFPEHSCPDCGAPAAPNRRGEWFTPFLDLFGSALRQWEGYFGYVHFMCECPQQPGPGLRVARLGDALIPLPFAENRQAREAGLDTDVFNCRRAAQAVDFLARHADPARTIAPDPLRLTLFSLASGVIGADEAYRRIHAYVNGGHMQDFDSQNAAQFQLAQV